MILLGFDIGGTKCAVTVGKERDGAVEILGKERFSTFPEPYAVLDRMILIAKELLAKDGLSFCDASAIGISCGGPLDSTRGVILSPPNLPAWDSIFAVDYVREKTGVPAFLQNDANACAVAEWLLGAGKGCKNMIFLTFGTGLGAGLILNGALYDGTNGNAGECGHIRLAPFGPSGYGKIGSFEGFCSGGGIAQLGKTMALEALQNGISPAFCPTSADISSVNAKTIGDAADGGDETALAVYRKSGEMLGYGLSILADILNPERIVIGSIFARSRHLLFDDCDAVMKKECLAQSYAVCRVIPAALGDAIGDYAALSLALSAVKR